jgi:hypothetical protein
MNNNDKILELLNNIISDINNNKYSKTSLLYLYELLIKFNFNVNLQENLNNDSQKQEMLKFLSVGWYIYNNLLESNPLPQ